MGLKVSNAVGAGSLGGQTAEWISSRARELSWAILGLGALLRLWTYFGNRSLWLDESMISLNLKTRSLSELLKPLDYHQFAPFGWTWFASLSSSMLGGLEYGLRFPALVAGLMLLFVARFITVRAFDRLTSAVILIFIAGHPLLIRYSSEVKSYGFDALVALLIFAITWSMLQKPRFGWRLAALLCIAGIAGIPFSMTAPFVLAASGGVLVLKSLRSGDRAAAAAYVMISAVWLVEFSTAYLNIYKSQMGSMVEGSAYVPFPSAAHIGIVWFPKSIIEFLIFFFNKLALVPIGAAALISIIWLVKRDRWTLAVLVLPFLIAMAAGSVGAYWFQGRFLLYYGPPLILLLGYSIRAMSEWLAMPRSRVAALFGLLVVAPSLAQSAIALTRNPPFALEEVKPALKDLSRDVREGDVVYLYVTAMPAFDIYKSRFGLSGVPTIYGHSGAHDWTCYIDDVERIAAHRRVWLLFSHLTDDWGMDEVKLFRYFASFYGREISYSEYSGASLALFEFAEGAQERAKATLPVREQNNSDCDRDRPARIPFD